MPTRDDPILREILDQAADLLPDRRPAYLDRACSGNAELRAEIENLLAALSRAAGFLVDPTLSQNNETASDREQFDPHPSAGEGLGTIGPYKLLHKIGE